VDEGLRREQWGVADQDHEEAIEVRGFAGALGQGVAGAFLFGLADESDAGGS
jgi:hypothetical protein